LLKGKRGVLNRTFFFYARKEEQMKKIIAYTEEQVKQIVGLLNCVSVSGIQNFKQIAAVAQILDSGMTGEIKEPEQKEGET
jgi:hypothetical protein